MPSLLANNANFFTSPVFDVRDANSLNFGIRDLLVVTLLSSVFALVLAMPVALGIALLLTQYAPKRVSRPFAYVGFTKESVTINGKLMRVAPRLEHGGAHLSDPEHQWGRDILARSLGGLARGALFAVVSALVIVAFVARSRAKPRIAMTRLRINVMTFSAVLVVRVEP